ncbi:TolC family protein [Sphingobacterium paludis]|uniref:NodT family efflux transporter outer membrane factor (OMF) lipoprotein n=1 Tax=Sphingobacterium paludis TaxID=1476465 RepID=A0A4R7CXD7_9SPHI|nr:TolC family protein [Sphingobacterium paludis]TDS13189.1 NodT family efflux transporter outer membrane factor (OMF) lipoprotein [Sphingobacterium paludis]
MEQHLKHYSGPRQSHCSKWFTGFIFAMLLVGMVCSCAVTKNYQRPNTADVSQLFRDRDTSTNDTSTLATIPYSRFFKDKNLLMLIDLGLQNNLDLKIAFTRIQAAAAAFRQSKQAFYPTLSAQGEVSYNRPSTAQARANGVDVTSIPDNRIYDLIATTSWEIDVWGKLRSTKRSQYAAFLASQSYLRTVQTQLVASIAIHYYQLLAYDEQLRILDSTVINRQQDVDIVKTLKQSAIVTGADIANSEANVKVAKLQIPEVMQQRREVENAMSILLGMPPQDIVRNSFDSLAIDSSLHTGVPAQLLAHRPDVQEAEQAFQQAFELTNVARTHFYPSLLISGSAGWATANTLQGFFTGTFYGSLLGGVVQPIFNQGLNRQRLATARATQDEAYYTFQNTMLVAGQEVSNALYSFAIAKDKEAIRSAQIIDLKRAADFTKELLRYTPNTNYTDVLTAEQNLLQAQLEAISDKLQQLVAVVELYRALGGGWTDYATPTSE